jgi:hypothetical protein
MVAGPLLETFAYQRPIRVRLGKGGYLEPERRQIIREKPSFEREWVFLAAHWAPVYSEALSFLTRTIRNKQ